VSVRYIKSGKPFIEGDYEDAYAAPGTVEAAVDAQRDGVNAVVINCTADTGYEACREQVSIPVVPPTQAAMHLSVQLAHRFSVLTFSVRTIPRFERLAWKFGLWNRLASVRSVELPLEGMNPQDEGFLEALFLQGKRCVLEDGAHSLIMGCTAFELVSPALREKFRQDGIPILILEPYLVALKTAEALARMGIR
jgi:allantoin racemase